MNRPDIRRLPKRANPQEAVNVLLDAVRGNIMPTEAIPLQDCLGRVLAEDVVSNQNIPSYDKTFLDGYAVNPEDTKGASTTKPVALKIVGKLFPPDYPTKARVRRGEVIYVACGAPIPKGAAATVKVEETRLRGETIEIVREIKTGEGTIPIGDDVKKGAVILKKGQVLRPQDIGLLASVQRTEVAVYRKPRISIISGGDELLRKSREEPTKIANNYALVVAGLASELGAEATIAGIAADTLGKVKVKISRALQKSDIVVTIGGSSVGVKDFVPDAVNALGKPGVMIQGILLRPGAISGFGIVDQKPVVMLPGHIGSCIAGFYMFVAPLISLYSGLSKDIGLPSVNAAFNVEVENGPQFRFLFIHLRRVDSGFVAEPVEGGSSALTTIVKSNGYTIVSPHVKLKKGDAATVFLFNKLEVIPISQQN